MKRTVKAWCIIHDVGKPQYAGSHYYVFKSKREAVLNRRDYETVVPCTITYEWPLRAKAAKARRKKP